MWDLMNMEEDDFYKRKTKVQKTESDQNALQKAVVPKPEVKSIEQTKTEN